MNSMTNSMNQMIIKNMIQRNYSMLGMDNNNINSMNNRMSHIDINNIEQSNKAMYQFEINNKNQIYNNINQMKLMNDNDQTKQIDIYPYIKEEKIEIIFLREDNCKIHILVPVSLSCNELYITAKKIFNK